MEEEKVEKKKLSLGQVLGRITKGAVKIGRKETAGATAVAKEVAEGFTGGEPLMTIRTKHRILAALSYLCVLVIIPLIFGRKIDYIRFHVNQGLKLLGFWVLGSFLFWLPYAGWLVVALWLVGVIVGLVRVFTGKERPLPVIGRIAV